MAEPTIIKCTKYHIYKPRLNFIKNSPLKKLLKLCQLYQLKARFPYILLLLLFTSQASKYTLNKQKALTELGSSTKTCPVRRQLISTVEIELENIYLLYGQNSQDTPEVAQHCKEIRAIQWEYHLLNW